MSIFNALSLIGGLALFLYGMNVMGVGLEKTAGGKLESLLARLTSTTLKGVFLGLGVTAVIQSSSATTVMVVGFVNSGIMQLSQAAGVIMGANIGTTVTSWILSLSGINSENVWIQLLNPSSFSPILAMIGIILLVFCKEEKKHNIGEIMLGFAVLMFGMEAMSTAVAPLAKVPEFTHLLLMFSNPLFGMLAGLVLTAIIQSSSASVGILQALCLTGTVPFSAATPIIMGQNIGTCVTALISSIGAKKNAKRAAFIHLYFNVIGTIICMTVFYSINAFVKFKFLNDMATPAGIAIVHSSFNICATLILFPFAKGLEKLATLTIRGKDEDEDEESALPQELQLLDDRFLDKPGFASAQCATVSNKMAELTEKALLLSLDLVSHYDKKTAKKVTNLEQTIDTCEDMLGTYLVKLSSKPLGVADIQKTNTILHSIGNFERISDHARNIAETMDEMNSKEVSFSDKSKEELTVYMDALKEILGMTRTAYETNDLVLAKKVEPLEEVIDNINDKAKKHHIKRMQKGKCTMELGIIFEDLITNFERVSDHCSNIAVCMIEVADDVYDTHEYLDTLKEAQSPEFQTLYQEYNKKYHI